MSVTLFAAETSVMAGQPVPMQVTIVNDSGSTATIHDVLIQSDANRPCTFVRSDELPATLANGDTLVVPFTATFRAPVQLDPATKQFLSFDCVGVVKSTVSGSYSETQSSAVTVNAINPNYPNANLIIGPNTGYIGLNLTSKKRAIAVPVVL